MRFIYTKGFAVFFACTAIVVVLMFLQVRGWLGPVRTIFLQSPRPIVYLAKGVAIPVKSFFSIIFQLKNITHENTDLRLQVVELNQKLADYDERKRENEALRKELGFVAAAKYTLAACTVLSQNPFGSTDTLVLNCGADQGVQEGWAVVSQGYLVGKVIYAGKSSSTVLLATSSRFSSDVELSKTGADAIVTGSFGSGLILDRLSQNDTLEKGWVVVTAGINPAVPKGILVGEVGEVLTSSNELFKKTTLLSPIRFSGLDFVFIVHP